MAIACRKPVEIVKHKDDMFNLIRWKEIYEMLEETTDRMEDVPMYYNGDHQVNG